MNVVWCAYSSCEILRDLNDKPVGYRWAVDLLGSLCTASSTNLRTCFGQIQLFATVRCPRNEDIQKSIRLADAPCMIDHAPDIASPQRASVSRALSTCFAGMGARPMWAAHSGMLPVTTRAAEFCRRDTTARSARQNPPEHQPVVQYRGLCMSPATDHVQTAAQPKVTHLLCSFYNSCVCIARYCCVGNRCQ